MIIPFVYFFDPVISIENPKLYTQRVLERLLSLASSPNTNTDDLNIFITEAIRCNFHNYEKLHEDSGDLNIRPIINYFGFEQLSKLYRKDQSVFIPIGHLREVEEIQDVELRKAYNQSHESFVKCFKEDQQIYTNLFEYNDVLRNHDFATSLQSSICPCYIKLIDNELVVVIKEEKFEKVISLYGTKMFRIAPRYLADTVRTSVNGTNTVQWITKSFDCVYIGYTEREIMLQNIIGIPTLRSQDDPLAIARQAGWKSPETVRDMVNAAENYVRNNPKESQEIGAHTANDNDRCNYVIKYDVIKDEASDIELSDEFGTIRDAIASMVNTRATQMAKKMLKDYVEDLKLHDSKFAAPIGDISVIRGEGNTITTDSQ